MSSNGSSSSEYPNKNGYWTTIIVIIVGVLNGFYWLIYTYIFGMAHDRQPANCCLAKL